MYSEKNKYPKAERICRNIDSIFLIPRIKELKEKTDKCGLVPTYSDILNVIEKKKKSRISQIIFALIVIFFFAIIPIKLLNTGNTTKAYARNSMTRMDLLYQSIEENNFEKAKQNILLLNNDIEHIQEQLVSIGQRNVFMSKFFPFKNINTNTENVLDIASSVLKIGTTLADDLIYFQNNSIENISNNENNEVFFTKIKNLNKKLEDMGGEIENINTSIRSMDENKLSEKEKKYFGFIRENYEDIKEYYLVSRKITKILPSVLGESFDKKYLILLQNNTELRATGGFIGSYGILTIRDAKIKSLFVDSIYNPDGQIAQKIEPPSPLKKVTEQLAMRDANWNPDFPSSAKTITSLYEKEGGFTPDGVIALDTRVFIDLLEITGPIFLEDYNLEISQDNFVKDIQHKTSIDYDPESGNPKKLLDDFAPIFIKKIFSLEGSDQNKALSVLAKNIKEKHIQLYSFNEKLQTIFSELDASGEIKDYDGDYFYYVNSNIGGLKTNDKISESLIHSIKEDQNNYIIHDVEITRKHNGTYDWPSGINYSYMRFYIPKDSQILGVENFEKDESIKKDPATGMVYLEERKGEYLGKAEIKNLDISIENDKTVVGTWQSIKPGETVISKISYKVPLKIEDFRYKILIQKQAGILSQETIIETYYNGKKIERKLNLTKDEEITINLSR